MRLLFQLYETVLLNMRGSVIKYVYMLHNLVSKNSRLLWLYHGHSSPSDCQLLPTLKQYVGGHSFKDDSEVEKDVTRWLMTRDIDWYQQGIEKLVPRYDKCLSFCKYYVEMPWDSRTVKFRLFFLESKVNYLVYVICKLIFWPFVIELSTNYISSIMAMYLWHKWRC